MNFDLHQRIALIFLADNDSTPREKELEELMGTKCPDWGRDRPAAVRWSNVALGRWAAKTATEVLAGYEAQVKGE